MLTRPCRHCGFHVVPEERHCPNCGRRRPGHRLPGHPLAVLAGAIGSGAGAGLGLLLGVDFPPGIGLGPLLVPLLGVLSAAAAYRQVDQRSVRRENLREHERVIRKRLRELEHRLDRIATVRARAAAHARDAEWERIVAALDEARRVLPAHVDRYRLKLFEVELARWHNHLLPLGEGLEALGFSGCERRLDALDRWVRHGEEMLADWQASGLEHQADGPDAERRLREALASGEELRKSLVARQARAVVASVRPAEEPPALPEAPASGARHLAEARAELGTLSAELEELEREHARLAAELEAMATLR